MVRKSGLIPVTLESIELEKKKEFIQYLRQYPVYAVKVLLDIDLAPHERIILKGMWNHKWVLNIAGRGTGKCACKNSLLYDFEKEKYITHEEAFNKYSNNTFKTLGMIDNYKIGPVEAKIGINGIKSCVEVKLKSGRSIEVTENHPLLKIDGWCEAGELKEKDRVAVARRLPEGNKKVSKEEARILGYLLGDGGITNYISFTNANEIILKDFKQSILIQFGKHTFKETPSGKATTVRVVSTGGKKGSQKDNIVLEWSRSIGIFGKKSIDKEVPSFVFSWNSESIAEFLGAYFDCDGCVDTRDGCAEYYSSSKLLLEGVQKLLLRFGIIAKLSSKKTNYKDFISYRLSITGSDNLQIFYNKIKSISGKLEKIKIRKANTNTDTIPKEVYGLYKNLVKKQVGTAPNGRRYKPKYSPSRKKLQEFGEDFEIEDAVDLANSDIFWDEVVYIKSIGNQETYAVEVQKYHNYLVDTVITHNTFMLAVYGVLRCLLYSGEKIVVIGPSFRQSIFVFNEMEKMWMKNPFLQQALLDKPKHHANEYTMIFRNGSTITALPLGVDGSKIRGTRATVIMVDEAAQVPVEIIDQAIIPFMTTKKNPMAQYLGITDDDSDNVLIFASSAYYQFNHLYDKYSYWLERIEAGDPKYFVSRFNYHDTPEGFIDLDVVELQRKTTAAEIFQMEYLAEFPRDSLGFFPASLVYRCVDRFVAPLKEGNPKKQYIMGLDPARSDDNFGVVILELNGDIRHIVHVDAFHNRPLPEMKEHICDLLERFNVIRIGCDKFGGGAALADLLREGHKWVSFKTGKLVNIPPILVIDDRETELLHGNRMLELVVFSSQTISDMNFLLKTRMENGMLRIPASPYVSDNVDEEAEKIFMDIIELKTELTSIVIESTKSEYLRFMSPEGQKKDRYSALLLANYAADHYLMQEELVPELPSGFWG
jgi:intein/homing endonuclease